MARIIPDLILALAGIKWVLIYVQWLEFIDWMGVNRGGESFCSYSFFVDVFVRGKVFLLCTFWAITLASLFNFFLPQKKKKLGLAFDC